MSNEELVTLYQSGDKRALESLVENNDGIIRKIAFKYRNINKLLELDDLIQSGYVGLITAANKYEINEERSANFITFAYIIIRQHILQCGNGRTSKDVENNKFYKSVKSLNIPVGEEENTELLDIIDSHDKSMENVEEQLYLKQLRSELEEAMAQTNTLIEREILKLRYGWNIKPMVLTEIGEILQITSERARQNEGKALRKIKNSVWGRTIGKKYRYEIIGPYECTYRDVEKKFDDELRSLYSM